MNKLGVPVLLLTLCVSGAAVAQQENMTLQQERDQIGADMEENRRQIGRDINAIREPGVAPGSNNGVGTAGMNRPNNTVGDPATHPQQAPAGNAGTSGVAPPNNNGGPVTTTGPGSSTVEPGSSTTTGTPVEPIRNSGANGNAAPNSGSGSGEIGTSGGNGVGTGAGASGGAGAGGGAAGAGN